MTAADGADTTTSLTANRADTSAVPSPRIPASGELDTLVAHRSLGLLVEAVEEYAIFSLDPTGAVQTWNVGARRIKGYTEREILGQHFSVFYLPEHRRTGIPDSELAHATTHGHWSGEGWRVRKDGAQFWANAVITAVFDAGGELHGFVKVTRDETDRKIAENNRRQLDVIAERERTALDIADTTVRGIFSAGLALHSALGINTDPRIADRLEDAINILDATLTQIRTIAISRTTTRDLPEPAT